MDLRYVMGYPDSEDGVNFPDDFAEALSSLLAAELAVPLTQTQALRDTCLSMYVDRLASARFNGAVEQLPHSIIESSWLDAHDGSIGQGDIDPRLRGLSGY